MSAFYLQAQRLFIVCICLFTFAQVSAQDGGYREIKAGYFGFDNILPSEVGPQMPHKGDFIGGVRWKDEAGENALIFSYQEVAKEGSRNIYAYQYRTLAGKTSLVWDIQDFGSATCQMTLAGFPQIIDLDQDGILEVCWMYQNVCDGDFPTETKLILMKDGKKLAIRGLIDMDDMRVVKKDIDPSVANFAPIFKNFMLMEWDEFCARDVTYSKSVAFKGTNFLVLDMEMLEASGGTYYKVLDLNGKPMDLGDMKEKIEYASTLRLMPDRKTILYASLEGIGTYDPISKKNTSFMTFFEDTEAISSLAWSPDGSKIAFTALNPNRYANATQIFVLTLQGNTMIKKDKYDAALMYMAASNWVVEAPTFKDNKTLKYTERIISDNGQEEGPVKEIKLN